MLYTTSLPAVAAASAAGSRRSPWISRTPACSSTNVVPAEAVNRRKIAGDEITFKVIRDRDGRKVTAKYKGKITGDTVKGKVESDWSGDWQTLDWEGTRGK